MQRRNNRTHDDLVVLVRIDRLLADPRGHNWLIILTSSNENVLPISVGFSEGSAIEFALTGQKPPRPLTHDLTCSLIKSLHGKIERVVIDDLRNETYYAKVYVVSGAGEHSVLDARPSDAIALALRARVPMYATRDLLRKVEKQEIIDTHLSKSLDSAIEEKLGEA